MKKISLVLSTIVVVFLTFSIVLFISCNKGKTKYNDSTLIRPCDNVICLNGGECREGLCFCPQGFEGVKCETKWNTRFLGTYLVDDACDTTVVGFYTTVINADSDFANKIKISNLGLFCSASIITAVINPEKTTFAIPLQNTCGNLYLSGYGNINNTFINIYLTSRDSLNHTSAQCSILLDKQ